MLRRANKPGTALDLSKEELARQESELRDQVEKLEHMIANAPRVAEEKTRQQREELLYRASAERTRLDVSVALQDKRFGEVGGSPPRRGSLRKQRREGQIIFLVLVIALAGVVIWLLTHLQMF
jgi:septal ring factor EnvC (AmiA/AmiB activator)